MTSAEVYDSGTGSWTYATDSLHSGFSGHTATLFPDGGVLITQSSSELFDRGLGFDAVWQPQISAINPPFDAISRTGPIELSEAGLLVDTLHEESDAYSVSGVTGNPLTNYYFTVQAVGCGADEADSNEVAEFDFGLTPGIE